MKTRLVLWSKNDAGERYLLALALDENKGDIDVWKLPEGVVTEELEEQLIDQWRKGEEVNFPGGYSPLKTKVSVTESILPEGLKAATEEEENLLKRVQAEWNYLMLSNKVYQAYRSELETLKEQIASLSDYSNEMWERLRSFWGKVQQQVRERTLFKDHADEIRQGTDELFAKMKELRTQWHEAFKKTSKENYEKLLEELAEIEKKIEGNAKFKKLFEELKALQRKVKETEFTKGHRRRIWEKIDKAFKAARRRHFGDEAEEITPLQRLEKRYAGLIAAIERMERSVERERNDLEFQERRISQADNQLEAELRRAKVNMIKERLHSKEEKLKDMLKTKIELEQKREKLIAREEERKRRAEMARKKKEAAEAARKKIEEEVQRNKEKLAASVEQQEKQEKKDEKQPETAEEKNEEAHSSKEANSKQDEGSFLEAAGALLAESLSDVVDTAKAIAEVVGDKIEDAVDELMGKDEEE